MAGLLEGRTVVVTGGTGALGAAVLTRLLADGAICHVPTRKERMPADFAFAEDGRVRLVPDVDLGDARSVDTFYETIPDLWASVHLAGAFAMSPLAETSGETFERMMAANAVSAFLCSRAAVRVMRRAATPGRIVNVAARPALEHRQGAGMVAYAASKAAVAAMTGSLAGELKGAGILVNAIVPSTLDTPANREAMPDADPSKWVDPRAAADTVAHLVSPGIAVSGALLPLYGRA